MSINKTKPGERRSSTINLRVGEAQKDAIDRAAAIQGKSRTEFILDAAYQEATSFLLDRKFFLVDDEAFAAFERQLEAAPDERKLRALLEHKAPWDDVNLMVDERISDVSTANNDGSIFLKIAGTEQVTVTQEEKSSQNIRERY